MRKLLRSIASRMSAISKILDSTRQLSTLAAIMLLAACTIEPPLRLPQETVTTKLPLVITDLSVVWNIDADWQTQWWYGWDKEDEAHWGKLEYPQPTNYEVRHFYQGEEQIGKHYLYSTFTVYGNSFRRSYQYGYHDLLIWSNIDSPDGTQTVIIDEKDAENIIASTTSTKVMFRNAATRDVTQKNQPEIFYRTYERDFYISRNEADYDYYDEEQRAWVKRLTAYLEPAVYIYLVQVVIYNNEDRIHGLTDCALFTNMSDGTNLNTGRTNDTNVDVTFDMRMKKALPARDGQQADIIGGLLTTFGLCGMDSWHASRGQKFVGSRSELKNSLDLSFYVLHGIPLTKSFDITEQVQNQPHGGVITIEIDANEIEFPKVEGTGFRPSLEDYEEKEYEFTITD